MVSPLSRNVYLGERGSIDVSPPRRTSRFGSTCNCDVSSTDDCPGLAGATTASLSPQRGHTAAMLSPPNHHRIGSVRFQSRRCVDTTGSAGILSCRALSRLGKVSTALLGLRVCSKSRSRECRAGRSSAVCRIRVVRVADSSTWVEVDGSNSPLSKPRIKMRRKAVDGSKRI